MTVKDIRNTIDAAPSLAPAIRTNGTANGAGVDLQGYHAAALFVHFGAYTDGTHTPTLEHSDDNSSFAAVSASELDGSLTAASSGAASGTVQRIGYRGSKRYLRGVMTVSGATSGAASSAMIVRGKASAEPL